MNNTIPTRRRVAPLPSQVEALLALDRLADRMRQRRAAQVRRESPRNDSRSAA